MLRFNDQELEKVQTILQSYNLDFGKKGTVDPFLRKLILNKETVREKQTGVFLEGLETTRGITYIIGFREALFFVRTEQVTFVLNRS